jgi:hypothetical protein
MEGLTSAAGGSAGGAADPVTAIANLGTEMYRFFQAGIDMVTFKSKARWDNLPQWLSPAEFQQEDYTMETILGGIAVAFIIIIIATAIVAVRK